jgi:hypothetical protein
MRLFLFIFSGVCIYRFDEGNFIQPWHYGSPIAIVILFICALYRRLLRTGTEFNILLILMVYFSIFNIFHMIIFHDYQILPNSLVWIANAMLMYLIAATLNSNEWKNFITFLVFHFSVSASIALYQLYTDQNVRPTGLSGTPNHIAIQAVHIGLLVLAVFGASTASRFIDTLGLVSISRAYFVYYLIKISLQIKNSPIIYLIFISIISIFGLWLAESANLINTNFYLLIESRFQEDLSDSNEGNRGYNRIFTNPESFILGASETTSNFRDNFHGQIHSNFIGLFFSFGFLGLVFSFIILRRIMKVYGILILLIYFMFSLSHYYWSNIIFIIFLSHLLRVPNRQLKYHR